VITDSQKIKPKIPPLSVKVKSWKINMDKIRMILTLVTIAIVVIPIVGMLLAYQGNLLGLFVTPEIKQIADDFMGGDGSNNGSGLEPPKMVGEPVYDEATGTFSVSFEYTNALPFDITVNSLSGNIECAEHHFPLGNATLSESVSINKGETGLLTIVGSWTDDAISHFGTAHEDEETVAVILADFAVDISGIQLQLDPNQLEQNMEGMEVPNPAFQG
jgi:hypothetical protein